MPKRRQPYSPKNFKAHREETLIDTNRNAKFVFIRAIRGPIAFAIGSLLLGFSNTLRQSLRDFRPFFRHRPRRLRLEMILRQAIFQHFKSFLRRIDHGEAIYVFR